MAIRPADHGIFASAVAGGPAGAGYFAGGGVSGAYLSTVDRFLFANDSRTTLGTGLVAATYRLAGMASPTYGYFGGGRDPSITDRVVKFLFSDDSRTTLGTGLQDATYALSAFASSTSGYFAGGQDVGGATDVVDKFLFSDDSRSRLSTALSANYWDSAGRLLQ